MILTIDQISANDWKGLSEMAHLITFNEMKHPDFDRITFALIAKNEKEILLSYVTCRETDKDTLYWQFGGSFPGTIKTSVSFLSYQAAVNWCRPRYKRIVMFIENTNIVMLKMAMKIGFLIKGMKVFGNHVLLEHVLEFKNDTTCKA